MYVHTRKFLFYEFIPSVLTLALNGIKRVDKPGRDKSLALVVSGHPVPVWVVRIEHCDALTSLHREVVLVLGLVGVKYDVATGSLLEKRKIHSN